MSLRVDVVSWRRVTNTQERRKNHNLARSMSIGDSEHCQAEQAELTEQYANVAVALAHALYCRLGGRCHSTPLITRSPSDMMVRRSAVASTKKPLAGTQESRWAGEREMDSSVTAWDNDEHARLYFQCSPDGPSRWLIRGGIQPVPNGLHLSHFYRGGWVLWI